MIPSKKHTWLLRRLKHDSFKNKQHAVHILDTNEILRIIHYSDGNYACALSIRIHYAKMRSNE